MKIITALREKDGIKYSYVLKLDDEATEPSPHTVEIAMKSNDGIINTFASRRLCADKARVSALFDRLVENLATPINLPYVIADEEL